MLLLRDLIRDLEIRLVAGEAGLDRPVRWVHISELADPTPWLSGGELLLTTGMNLSEPEAQRAFVERLVAHDLSGLGLGVGFAHAEAPDALREAAAELGLPAVRGPLRRAVHRGDREGVLAPGQRAVRGAAARALRARAARADRAVRAGPRRRDRRAGDADRRHGARLRRARRRARPQRRRAPLAPEVLDATGDELRERARAGRAARLCAVGRAARARAGAAGRAHAGARERRRPGAAGVARRGQGPRRPRRVRPARAAPGRHDRRARAAAPPRRRRHRAAAGGRRAVGDGLGRAGRLRARPAARAVRAETSASACWCCTPPRSIKALVEDGADRGAARRGCRAGWPPAPAASPARCCRSRRRARRRPVRAGRARARARLARARPSSSPAGAGRAVAAADLRRTFHEARCALEAQALSGEADGDGAPQLLATFRDLGSFQLLLSLQDDDALRLFCDSILAPIEDGEGAYGGELMRSLEAFIECNGQWERAARQLYCHRHTLRYRIRARRGAHRAGRSTPRATGSTSGSPCAAASWCHDPKPRKRGVIE